MKRYMVTAFLIAIVSLALFVFPNQFSDSGVAAGQNRGSQRAAAPTVRRPSIDYSKFLHATKKHQEACNTCHRVPTSNWRKVREYPDIADYPGHEACVSCHRSQFFRGAKPVICAVCHSRVSPRDNVRFAFGNPADRSQFMIEFPHDKHQDVIATLFRRLPREAESADGKRRRGAEDRPEFVRAAFPTSGFMADDQTRRFNNCEICHGPRTTPPIAPASGWIDGFVPDNLTLKAVPTSHSSCFSCHWKSEQPVSDNCAGCHKLLGPSTLPAVADSPKRISIKFRHQGPGQHVAECTNCHINITKASTLKGLKPDVPITSCGTDSCHNSASVHHEIANELDGIRKDRQFVCHYCHTSDVGRRDAPRGHYLIVGLPPLRREEIK